MAILKHKILYILYICCSLFFSTEGFSQEDYSFELETVVDTTLTLDKSSIKPREFSNLKERYSGDDFIYERTEASSGWWSRFKQWLSDLWKSLFDIDSNGKAAKLTDIILNIAAVIIVLLVIYFIYKAIINKEGKWVFGKSPDRQVIPITSIENNIHETDFETLINSAEAENNYRLAIRYYYLWLLKQLSFKNIITYDAEKTNSDYQLEINNPQNAEKFAYTSYLYNYIWYGEFNVDEHQFLKAKKAFVQFLNSVKNG